jgi:hypothetical protein
MVSANHPFGLRNFISAKLGKKITLSLYFLQGQPYVVARLHRAAT